MFCFCPAPGPQALLGRVRDTHSSDALLCSPPVPYPLQVHVGGSHHQGRALCRQDYLRGRRASGPAARCQPVKSLKSAGMGRLPGPCKIVPATLLARSVAQHSAALTSPDFMPLSSRLLVSAALTAALPPFLPQRVLMLATSNASRFSASRVRQSIL